MKKFLLLIAIPLLTACGPNAKDFKSSVEARPAFEDRVVVEEVGLPPTKNITAPFYAQAPDGNWDFPWKEACEEASLILAHYGMMGETLTKAEFKEIVLDMVEWQKGHFGYYEDTTLAQTEEMYKLYFEDHLETEIIENPSLPDIQNAIAEGKLVVAPFAGRMLGNPFYSGEGPYYHMLVIKGYDGENFITNDVGTRRGADFIYPYRTLMAAIHDYRSGNIENAPSRVLVLSAAEEQETPSQEQ